MPTPSRFTFLLPLLYLLLPSSSASILTISPISISAPNITCIDSGFYNCSGTCPCNFSQNYYHYTVIAISVVTMIWCILFTIAYFCVKQLRQKPGEIILIATIANFLLALSFGFQNVRLLILNSPTHKENTTGCFILGAFTMFFINAISVYQLVYYGYNATTLRKPINASRITRKRYHAASFLATGILTLSEIWFGSIGRTILGTCSLKTTSSIVLPIATNAVMMLLDFIIAFMIRRNFRKRIKDLNARQTRYVEHYLGYIIVLCIVLLGIGAVEIDIATKIDNSLTAKTLEEDSDAFNSLQICSFILINLVPLILILGRIRDPTVWRPLKKKVRSLWESQPEEGPQAEDDEIKELEPSSPSSPVHESPRDDLNKRLLAVDALPVMGIRPLGTTQSPSVNSGGISSSGSSFPRSFKACEDSRLSNPNQVSKTKDPKMFYSIFAGIHYHWHLQKNGKKEEKECEVEGRKEERNLNYYKRHAVVRSKFTLHESLLKHTVPQIYREIKGKHYKIRFGIFTAYAPGLFSELIENDEIAGELQSSLELMQNFSNVMSAGTELHQAQFLTYNSKFIVRHITKNDRRTLMKILPKYMHHLKTKPYSLLTRIYGLFRFEVMNPYQQVNWLIMKNITQKSSSSIERMYEIKGVAAQQRKSVETLGPEGERAILRELGSLGDEYFEKNEHSIYVDANVRGPLLETLKSDIEFLVGEGLYDYSLNVSIVNRAKMTSDQRLSSSVILEVEEDEWSMTCGPSRRDDDEEEKGHRRHTNDKMGFSLVSQVNIQNPFFALKSTKENLFYSLEIDSYLTRYDWKKKLKYYMGGCKDDEGCLQPPPMYGARLEQYVKQIISSRDYSFGNLNHETEQSRSGESSTLEK